MREQHGPLMEEQSNPRFGNYDLVRRIDVGGMGEVYLARQRTAFGRPVAIKIIRSDLVHDITARARFLREAEVSAHLKHEHILPLFEFGEDQGRLFLVTPYIEGGTLARYLKSGPLSLEEVHHLFVPLVQAVAYIHRRGVIHRDLKPTNILLDSEDGQIYVRLIDFGIASLSGRSASPPLTTAGNEVGTIAYMAPERLSGVAAPSNDIFSLGVILYQMLTGHFPASLQHSKLPQALEYVVRHCIAQRPEERFASAEEVLQAFERAYQYLTASPSPDAQVPPSMPHATRDGPTVNPASVSRPLNTPLSNQNSVDDSWKEHVALQHVEDMPVLESPPRSTFSHDDYGAPTTSFDPAKHEQQRQRRPTPPPPSNPAVAPPPRKRRGRSLLVAMSAFMLIIVLVIAGMLYYGYQSVYATSVTVNFSSKPQVVSQVFTITANPDPSVKSVNVDTKTIPAKVFVNKRSGTGSAQTTGKVNCIIGLFCQQAVADSDVSGLADKMRPNLQNQLTLDLQKQIAAVKGTQAGSLYFNDVSVTPTPDIRTVSNTVTVTLVEQGSVEYIVNADAVSVAQQLLIQQAQKLGPNYIFPAPGSMISFGSPVVESIDNATKVLTLKIAAAGIALYHFPATELQTIKHHLQGQTVNNARIYIGQQQGVDSATINIKFTRGGGTTLPGDLQQIQIVTIDPTTLPVVDLPKVPTPTSTPSTNVTPSASPTANT